MKNIFESFPISNGNSWTIVSILGRIIIEAESMFGQRNKEFTILGVEINNFNYPQLYLPGNRKDIIIQVTKDCFNDINRAVYQVSHEVIHSLHPKIGGKANILEEGMATYFSIHFTSKYDYGKWEIENPKYQDALNQVQKLLQIDDSIIAKLRIQNSQLSELTIEDFKTINKEIPNDLINKLLQEF